VRKSATEKQSSREGTEVWGGGRVVGFEHLAVMPVTGAPAREGGDSNAPAATARRCFPRFRRGVVARCWRLVPAVTRRGSGHRPDGQVFEG